MSDRNDDSSPPTQPPVPCGLSGEMAAASPRTQSPEASGHRPAGSCRDRLLARAAARVTGGTSPSSGWLGQTLAAYARIEALGDPETVETLEAVARPLRANDPIRGTELALLRLCRRPQGVAFPRQVDAIVRRFRLDRVAFVSLLRRVEVAGVLAGRDDADERPDAGRSPGQSSGHSPGGSPGGAMMAARRRESDPPDSRPDPMPTSEWVLTPEASKRSSDGTPHGPSGTGPTAD